MPEDPHPVAVEGGWPRHQQGRGRGHHGRNHAHHPEEQRAPLSHVVPSASPPGSTSASDTEDSRRRAGPSDRIREARVPDSSHHWGRGCWPILQQSDHGSGLRQSWPVRAAHSRRTGKSTCTPQASAEAHAVWGQGSGWGFWGLALCLLDGLGGSVTPELLEPLCRQLDWEERGTAQGGKRHRRATAASATPGNALPREAGSSCISLTRDQLHTDRKAEEQNQRTK